MTLEEAKTNALQGDFDSIMALGRYYFGEDSDEENRDIGEAIKWYEKGSEFGYSRCMFLVSILYCLKGHAMRKIAGGNLTPDKIIPDLEKGLSWAQKAKNLGEPGSDERIVSLIGEIGIAYYYCALGGEFNHPNQENSIKWFSESIRLLKSIYTTTADPEVFVILAFALNGYGEIVGFTDENNKLEFYLYNKVINEYFGQVMHSELCACYLGMMYTDGRGCPVDYNKAVQNFQMAHNAGFDCSETLSMFKKKMFGGWTLK